METMINDAFRNYRQDAANLDESDMVETKYVLNEWARVDNGGFHDFINNGSQYCKMEAITQHFNLLHIY